MTRLRATRPPSSPNLTSEEHKPMRMHALRRRAVGLGALIVVVIVALSVLLSRQTPAAAPGGSYLQTNIVSDVKGAPTSVAIPAPTGIPASAAGAPTGVVFNGSSSFIVRQGRRPGPASSSSRRKTAPSRAGAQSQTPRAPSSRPTSPPRALSTRAWPSRRTPRRLTCSRPTSGKTSLTSSITASNGSTSPAPFRIP